MKIRPGSRVVACGQTDGRTDRHDEANSRNFVNALKKRNEEIERRFSVLFDALPTMEEAEVEENWLRESFTEGTLNVKLSDTRCALPALCTY
jgi:hypothetical protein